MGDHRLLVRVIIGGGRRREATAYCWGRLKMAYPSIRVEEKCQNDVVTIDMVCYEGVIPGYGRATFTWYWMLQHEDLYLKMK